MLMLKQCKSVCIYKNNVNIVSIGSNVNNLNFYLVKHVLEHPGTKGKACTFLLEIWLRHDARCSY